MLVLTSCPVSHTHQWRILKMQILEYQLNILKKGLIFKKFSCLEIVSSVSNATYTLKKLCNKIFVCKNGKVTDNDVFGGVLLVGLNENT